MADNQIVIKLRIDDKGNLKKASSQTEKLSKSTDKAARSTDKLQKSRDKYNRTEKGVASMSSSSTKNFSKMQQSIGGGDGSGGLVRAYALLAANVFALTAAFGVLSRASQIEVLTQSIERLEIVSGKSIRQVGRDLQEASGFSLDFASSLRSVSLATSAGFNAKQIQELGEVAKNASVSLGRNLADGLDRIFRGVIKVEPELLDEIGLFVRVNEAANKYAADLGVAASDLTEFQKRQAFANEAITQGQKKFSAFADIDPAPLDKLAASLSDIAQSALSVVTSALNPILSFFQENQQFLAAAFSAVAFALLRQAVPALGTFAINAKQAALDAQAAFTATEKAAKDAIEGERAGLLEKALKKEKDITKEVKKRATLTEKGRSGFGGKGVDAARAEFKAAETSEQKITALGKERDALNLSKRRASADNIKLIEKEQGLIDKQILKEKSLMRAVKARKKVQSQPVPQDALQGTQFDLAKEQARVKVLRQTSVESISNKIAIEGFGAGLKELGKQTGKSNKKLQELGFFTRAASKASIAGQGAFLLFGDAVSKTMRFLGPITLLLSIAGPLFVSFAKFIGLTSKESDKYNKSLAATNELQETFAEKLEHSAKTLGMLSTDKKFSFTAQADALAAANAAVMEFLGSINDLIEAERELANQRKGQKLGLLDTVLEGGRIEEIEGKLRSFLKGVGEGSRGVSDEVLDGLEEGGVEIRTFIKTLEDLQAAREAQSKAGPAEFTVIGSAEPGSGPLLSFAPRPEDIEVTRLQGLANTLLEKGVGLLAQEEQFRKGIFDLTVGQDKASQNIKSAIEGATDSVREFQKAFITKTDIDKPLSSIIALNKGLKQQIVNGELINLTGEERTRRIESIKAGEGDILTLLDIQIQRQLEGINLQGEYKDELGNKITGEEKFIKILEEEEEKFRQIQVNLAIQKKNIALATAEMKIFSGATKESVQGILAQSRVTTLNLERQQKLAKDNADNARNAAKIDKDKVKDLMKLDDEALKEALKKEKDRLKVLGAITAQKELDLKIVEVQLARNLEIFRVEQKMLELRLGSVNASIKANDAVAANLKLRAEIAKLQQGRGGQLTPGEELELELKAFKAGKKDRDERIELEDRIGELKRQVMVAEFNTFLQRHKIEVEFLKTKLLAEKDLTENQKEAFKNVEKMINQASSTVPEAANKLDSELRTARLKDENDTLSFYKKLLTFQDGIFKQDPNKFLELGEGIKTGLNINEKKGVVFDQMREDERRKLAAGDINQAQFDDATKKIDADEKMFNLKTNTLMAANALTVLSEGFKQFGPDGEVGAAMAGFGATLSASFAPLMTEGEDSAKGKIAAVGSIVGSLATLMTSASNAKIAGIDREIDAEKKRDGKSKQSLEKIKQMEAKKEQMAKKAFEQNKKMQIAMTIINTATAIMGVMAHEGAKVGTAAIVFAALIGAMGAAQIGMIKNQQYQGSGSSDTGAAASPMNLSIGSRGNEVNVANQANRGELAFLRGEAGRGSVSNFTPAASGRRGYAAGSEGVVVGERGPEVITPSMPIDITANDKIGGGNTNVNFTIHAVDAAGLEQTIQSQRGNIIGMIREAANGYGINFLENVDVDTLDESGGTY